MKSKKLIEGKKYILTIKTRDEIEQVQRNCPSVMNSCGHMKYLLGTVVVGEYFGQGLFYVVNKDETTRKDITHWMVALGEIASYSER